MTAVLNRIIPHHSGGGYAPNATDRRAYNRLITGDGERLDGMFPPERNGIGRIVKGQYAAHTAMLNGGSVGVALCAMRGGQWGDPFNCGHFPKPAQVDALVLDIAELCVAFGVPVTERTVLSHAEVEPTLGVKQRNKWDFDYDPRGRLQTRDPIAIGNELRQEVRLRLRGLPPVAAQPVPRPVLAQGATGLHVRQLQAALGVTADGAFGPRTRAAVVAFQRRQQLLPDGIVGRMTWAALGL